MPADFLYIFPLREKTFKGDYMIYEIRLKGRRKQGECSAILTMAFFVIVLTAFSMNLIPMVYITAVRPMLSGLMQERIFAVILSTILLVFSLAVYCCLSFGADRFMLKRAENTIAGAGDIFYYFAPKRFFELCDFYFKLIGVKCMIFLLLSLPFVICAYILYTLSAGGFSALVCWVFAVFSLLFLFLAIATFSKVNDTFFLARYRFIRGDYLNFRHLLARSQYDMSDKTAKLRLLRGSFIGWFLLCILIVPIPYVWCYYRQTKACFAVM